MKNFITFLDRSRLALSAGLAVIATIGTIKFVSPPLHQALYTWEGAIVLVAVPLAYLALRRYNIS